MRFFGVVSLLIVAVAAAKPPKSAKLEAGTMEPVPVTLPTESEKSVTESVAKGDNQAKEEKPKKDDKSKDEKPKEDKKMEENPKESKTKDGRHVLTHYKDSNTVIRQYYKGRRPNVKINFKVVTLEYQPRNRKRTRLPRTSKPVDKKSTDAPATDAPETKQSDAPTETSPALVEEGSGNEATEPSTGDVTEAELLGTTPRIDTKIAPKRSAPKNKAKSS